MNTFLAFLCGILLLGIVILLFGIFASVNKTAWDIWNAVFGIESP